MSKKIRITLERTDNYFSKSPTVWGHEENSCHPIAYIRRAKHATNEEWNAVLEYFGFKNE